MFQVPPIDLATMSALGVRQSHQLAVLLFAQDSAGTEPFELRQRVAKEVSLPRIQFC